MILKNIKKQKWKFQVEKLEETCKNLINPARGWYSVYTFWAEQKINPEELRWSLREGETVVLVLLDIETFRDRPLNNQALENIRNILKFFEDYKRDVIFRPVYDREGKGLQHEPEDFSIVLTHLQQLGELLSVESYSVFIFQGLLVGSWGEMHTSRYLSEECLKEMWNTLRSRLNKEIMTAVRTPAQWRTLIDESEYQKRNFHMTGLFDDGIFGSSSHLGTFGTMTQEAAGWKNSWNRKEEIDFINWITKEIPCGGEATTCMNDIEAISYTPDFIINELRMLHLTYLNSTYNMKILATWKKITYNASEKLNNNSLYEYIGNHLGYCLIIKKIETKYLRREKIEIDIEIENVGFGKIFQETESFLVIKNKENRKKIPIFLDLRKIYPGNQYRTKLIFEAVEGEVFLELYRKKDGRNIYFANKNRERSFCLGYLYKI